MQPTLRYLRCGSITKRNLGARLALLVMLAAGTPAPAADTIEELLRQDEASSQNDALRLDLNALTEAEWEYYFHVGLKKIDTQLDSKLVEHESDWSLVFVYVWIAAVAAVFGMAMGLAQHAPRTANTDSPGPHGGLGPHHCSLCGVRREAATLTPAVSVSLRCFFMWVMAIAM
jgi:hypothetical protein